MDGDEDDQEDAATPSNAPEAISRAVSESVLKTEPPSKVPSPKPHPLSISFQASDIVADVDTLENALKPLESDIVAVVDIPEELNTDVLPQLDMSALGPDGTGFESTGDLTQMQPDDTLLGGEMMDDSISDDPFALPPP